MSNYKKTIIQNITLYSLAIFTFPSLTFGSEPIQFTNSTGGDIERFRLDPTSQYIIFNEFNSSRQLNRFSTQIDGKSETIQIANDLDSAEDNFWIDPDDLRVLNRESNADDSSIQGNIRITEINGLTPSIFIPSPQGEDINRINTIDENTNFVMFSTNGNGLYSTLIDGSSEIFDLTNGIESNHAVDRFRITRDRQRVIFSAEILDTRRFQLFVTNIDGSSTPTLITELPENTDTNGNTVVSNVTDTIAIYNTRTFLGNGVEAIQIFSVTIAENSAPIALSEPLIGDNLDVTFSAVQDDLVIYINENIDTGVSELYVSPIDGSSSPILIDSGISIHHFDGNGDSRTLVYSITEPISNSSNHTVLKSISLDNVENESPVIISQLNGNIGDNIDTSIDFVVSNDDRFVFYADDSVSPKRFMRASINNSSPLVRIVGARNNIRIAEGSPLEISNNNVFFIGHDLEQANQDGTQIFSSPINSSNVITTITEVSSATINDFDITQNGQFAAYTSEDDNGLVNLFSLRLPEAETCFPIESKTNDISIICF